MPQFGKRIQLFLLDGTPNGRWICELSNWTGIVYKIPRNYVLRCEDRKELLSPGIYFLFGKDETAKPLIYIGEAENIMNRLKQHLRGKDYWNEVIVFTSKDTNLNKAHIKYLENRFYTFALEARRYRVMNSSIPTRSSISEAEQSELEEFLYNAKIMVNTLGHKVFESFLDETEQVKNINKYYINVANVSAVGIPTADGFVLLKGSIIHNNTAFQSVGKGIAELIRESRKDGKIVGNELQEDMLFATSSAAAAFAMGYAVSGPKTWKNAQGATLKEVEE